MTTGLLSRVLPISHDKANFAVLLALLCLLPPALSLPASAQSSPSSPVSVKTDNDSVNVVIQWTQDEIQAGQDVDISMEFQDPSSGQAFSHVNYSLKIIDPSTGEIVQSLGSIHTHTGKDVQTVKLDRTGDLTLEIDILGLGISQPYDTTKSGTAQTSIMVVPEFPFAVGPLIAGMAVIVMLLRFRQRGYAGRHVAA